MGSVLPLFEGVVGVLEDVELEALESFSLESGNIFTLEWWYVYGFRIRTEESVEVGRKDA